MPNCARACIGLLVILEPWKYRVPVSTCSRPEIRLSRVVLPAPFGPIKACNSPGISVKFMSSQTDSPPKDLPTSCNCSIGSAMIFPLPVKQQAIETAPGKEDYQDQKRAQNNHPVLSVHGKVLFQEEQGSCTQYRACQGSHAA